MGLFVAEDGHFQSWFSAIICCCAAIDQDESPIEREKQKKEAATAKSGATCNEQPLPLAELPATPLPYTPAGHGDREPILRQPRPTTGLSDRPPSLSPLDLGEPSLNPRWSLIGRPKTSPSHIKKLSISAPYAFRRIDGAEAQQQQLVPLRLGPVVLRESPVPPESHSPTTNFTASGSQRNASESTEDLIPDGQHPSEQHQSYRTQRDNPFKRCQQRSSTVWPLPPPPAVAQDTAVGPYTEAAFPLKSSMPSRSSSGSLRRNGSGRASVESSIGSRSSNERLRPKRKRSVQSVRKSAAEAADQELEREVMELNTIVEERRLDAARSGTPDQHVAAIAPNMRVRARAETLDAIGSALSRPLTAQSLHRTSMALPERPVLRRSASTTIRPNSRVSGWLSGLLTSSSASRLPTAEPFYKCQMPPRTLQRPTSESSMRTVVTELDSPSLTPGSSPTTKGHSRSHTGESRFTPISPATTFWGAGDVDDRKGKEDLWPTRTLTPTSQVGLAF